MNVPRIRIPAPLANTFLAVCFLLSEHAAGAQQTAGRVGEIRATHLECESTAQPLGVESSHPHLSWWLEPVDKSARGLKQSAYRILVATTLDKLTAELGDVWDTGKVTSAETTQIEYTGQPLRSDTTYYWQLQVWGQNGVLSPWSEAAEWTTGLMNRGDWKAKWIAAEADATKGGEIKEEVKKEEDKALPIFRHEFSAPSGVKSALIRISGLGQYELRINGQPVNENTLAPGWTDYRKRVFYDTFDVTKFLRTGENAIGILVGNGMYNVAETPGRYQKFVASMGLPKLIVQLRITLDDGKSLTISSDKSWKQAAGPITFSSVYGGEDFDARREPRGWDAPGFDDHGWLNAVEVSGPGGQLKAESIPTVKVMRSFPAVKITEPKPGVRVYDLGQNFSGWPKINTHGAAGTVLKLIPGELLDVRGFVSQQSSGGPVWFSYVLRGSGEEIWHPRFSYYGFRYVQVEETQPSGGSPQAPALLELEGQFVHSSAARTGEFSSSSDLFNRIHGLIVAAVESNMQSVLTDCPHREKLGWLEETHLLGDSLMDNYELSGLYAKMADDVSDAQLANGLVPDIAPEFVVFERGFRDSPEWGSAAILSPWLAYRHYGDARILTEHYDTMRRYAAYLGSTANHGIVSHGLGDWYDIGPGEPGESKLTGRGLTGTAIYYQDLTVMERIAALLGKKTDAEMYSRAAKRVRNAFNRKLFHAATHQYDTGSQTANAMPLATGLVPDSERAAVLGNLIEDIRKHGNHVTAGDVGFHYVVVALMEGGRSDVLFDMTSRDDDPSYGYQLKRGATTLTEAWDTNPNDSQNHFMLGHIEEWFHRGLAGVNIDLSRPKRERIAIRPAVVGDVTWARDAHDSVLGRIASEWRRHDGKLELNVTIPAKETAIVFVPSASPDTVSESGQPADKKSHIRRLKSEPGSAVFEVDSGEYHFESAF